MATTPCPLCGTPIQAWERYPSLICGDCAARARDEHGRSLRFFNETALGGGFAAEVDDGGVWRPADGARCWVDGRACVAGEHRFGGIAVQLADA